MHPRPGQRSVAAPPPTERIKALLPQFGDLPKEAEEEARTIDSLQATVRQLKGKLTQAKRAPSEPDKDEIQRLKIHVGREADKRAAKRHWAMLREITKANDAVVQSMEKLGKTASAFLEAVMATDQMARKCRGIIGEPWNEPAPVKEHVIGELTGRRFTSSQSIGDDRLSGPQHRILDNLAWLEAIGISEAARIQLAFLASQSPKSGAYANNLGALRSRGLVNYPLRSHVALTDEGRQYADAPDAPVTTEALHKAIFTKVSGPQTRILRTLIDHYPQDLSKHSVAEMTQQSPISGAYANSLGFLRSLGLIDYPMPGRVVALPILFLEERK